MTPGPADRSGAGPDDLSPLDLLEALAHIEVATGPRSRHTEILTRAGKLGLLWDGPPDAARVLVACGGALGGFLGPAGGLYFDLAGTLADAGVATVRVDYRLPGDLSACVLDVAVAIELARHHDGSRFVVLGHSFGGAVAIGVGAIIADLIAGVVSLAGQSAGCEPAAELGRIPLLLVHGEKDEIIPSAAAEAVRQMAGHGELVMLPGTGHLLDESGALLRAHLPPWILGAFQGGPGAFGSAGAP